MTFLRVIQFALLTALIGSAQTGGGTTGGGGGTTGGGGSTGGTTTTPPGTSTRTTTTTQPSLNPSPANQDQARPMYLAGRVRVADGSTLTDRVAIERVCNGRNQIEGYTDSKGNFSIQLGQNNLRYADASQSGIGGFGDQSSLNGAGSQFGGGVTERSLLGCELRAALPGFRSDIVSLSNRRFMDNPDLGIILLHRMSNVEGLTTSGTSALAPKDARKAFEKGLDLARKAKLEDAQREFEKALDLYPRFAAAYYELGRVQDALKKPEAARANYQKSMQADSRFLKPYEALYMIAVREQKWQDVADLTEKVTKMNPFEFPGAFSLNAMANLNLQKPGPAEVSIREAIKLDANNRIPRNQYLLGLILAQKQDYDKAMPILRTYLESLETSARFDGNFAAAKEAEVVKRQISDLERYATAKTSAPQN